MAPIRILSGHWQTNSNTISTNRCQLTIINWTTIISPLPSQPWQASRSQRKNVNKGFVLQICQENIIPGEAEMSNVSTQKQSTEIFSNLQKRRGVSVAAVAGREELEEVA